MASATKVHLSTDVGDWPEYYRTHTGLWSLPKVYTLTLSFRPYLGSGITQEQSKKASEVLQENHDQYHMFFHPDGLHNHIAHHILAIWALNASTDSLSKNFEKNKKSQRPQPPVDNELLEKLSDSKEFINNLGPRDNYHTFLQFFQREIENSNWKDVLQKYLFAGDERAETMLVRMYGGFLHRKYKLGQ